MTTLQALIEEKNATTIYCRQTYFKGGEDVRVCFHDNNILFTDPLVEADLVFLIYIKNDKNKKEIIGFASYVEIDKLTDVTIIYPDNGYVTTIR